MEASFGAFAGEPMNHFLPANQAVDALAFQRATSEMELLHVTRASVAACSRQFATFGSRPCLSLPSSWLLIDRG